MAAGTFTAMNIELVIEDWHADPSVLKVTISFPALPYLRANYFHRKGIIKDRATRGWFLNDSQGSSVDEPPFSDLLDSLVFEHATLSKLAANYDIGGGRYDLLLTGASREIGWIQAIKEVRCLTNLGLKEAKDAVDNAILGVPFVILSNVTLEEAEVGRDKFRAIGAEGTIRRVR